MIRVPRWKILATMFFCGVLGSVATWGLSARASNDPAVNVYRMVRGTTNAPEKVIFRCSGWAEDSFYHIVPTKWQPERDRVVLRCQRNGY